MSLLHVKKALFTATHSEHPAMSFMSPLRVCPFLCTLTERHHQVSQHQCCVASVQDDRGSVTEETLHILGDCISSDINGVML